MKKKLKSASRRKFSRLGKINKKLLSKKSSLLVKKTGSKTKNKKISVKKIIPGKALRQKTRTSKLKKKNITKTRWHLTSKIYKGTRKQIGNFKFKIDRRFIFFSLPLAVILFFFYLYILKDLPQAKDLKLAKTPFTTIIRDRNGTILYRIYNNANRIKLTWDEIPDNVKKATLAIEDADFYSHQGISLKAITRAFLANINEENINLYQGGSTITQQLVKNRLLSPKKSYIRKIKEIILAFLVEKEFTKQDIFTMYLNEVGFGGPAYGIGAASQMYFNKNPQELTLAEAAFLAGLPAAPTTFSPFGVNPDLAVQRQLEVLNRMKMLRLINGEEYQNAVNEKLNFAPQKIDILAPHFVMYVKSLLVDKFGEQMVEEGGLDVTTTLDLKVQNMAEDIVKKNISEIKDRFNIHNASALVTNPTTGEILAMVGNADYWNIKDQGYVNVTTSLRQPGSSIKVVNYAYAFDHNWNPNSTIDDSPVVYFSPGSPEKYSPQNYDGRFHGRVTLRTALANSYNVPAVKLLNSYGVDKMKELGRLMGIRSWDNLPPIGLSLTLGAAEVTVLDMARVYGTVANLGVKKDLKAIQEIRNTEKADITQEFYKSNSNLSVIGEVKAEENQQVISPLAAYWLTDILSDNKARLTAFGPYAKLTVPGYKIAVKTGTSNYFRDNWTIGFSPDYLVATWVGNTDGKFMNKNLVSGITGAAPIWNQIMTNLVTNGPPKDFPIPQGLIPIKVCAVNGLLTCPNCPEEKIEYFTADKVPTKKCFFRPVAECEEAKKQAEGKTYEERKQILAGCALVN